MTGPVASFPIFCSENRIFMPNFLHQLRLSWFGEKLHFAGSLGPRAHLTDA